VKKFTPLLAAFCAFFSAGAALADPPTVVGRLSLVEGAASIRHSYDQQWTPGGINFPVIAGDGVWSDQGSRTEVEIGGSEARLDETSELDIDRLDESGAALRVPQGVVNLIVRYLPPGGLQVLTSVGQLSIRQPGEYHIDAGRPNGPPTQIVMGVISGDATFSGLRGVTELRSGQGAMVPPDQSLLQVVAIYPTPFDQWAENRAGQLAASQTITYVSPEVTGYQDLDTYGSWQTVPDYGPVWFPTSVAIGWAPYHNGHWAYVRPWGWTWIDDAPWGFAPFHYGRWAEFDGRWAWIPGERHERPFYAPALVAFVGGEPGGAHVGWVALGPHEVFHPYYEHSDTYVIALNRAHFRDEHEIVRWDHAPPPAERFANNRWANQGNANAFQGGQAARQAMPQPGNRSAPQQPAAQPAAAAAQAPRPGTQPPQQQFQQPLPQPHPQPTPGVAPPPRPTPAPQQQPQPPQQFQQPHPVQAAPQPQPQQPRPQPQQQQQQQPKKEPQDHEHQAQH
jgi:hypothetical protein